MQYALLIYDDESKPVESWDAASREKFIAEFMALTADMRARGILLASQRLAPTDTATTVHIRNGQEMVTDGPFAETKEALGGFYLIEARDLDEALELGAACPGAKYGSIEVRPIQELPSA